MLELPFVSVVILNWNGWRDTLECLKSLEALTYDNYKIVVVDNASTDGSEQRIREAYPNLILIQSGANLGFAGGNNVGIKHALLQEADFVWLLNNDTVVEPDALTHLVQRIQADPKVGMCGSTLVYYHSRNTIQAYAGGNYNYLLGTTKQLGQGKPRSRVVDVDAVEDSLDYVEASSLLVSRQFLEEVGLMCEDYFLYYEEIDWVTRAGGRYRLAYAPDSVVYHKEGASIGGSNYAVGEKSWTADYYSIRNRILITKRFFPYALITVYLSLLVVILNRVRRGQWKRVKMVACLVFGGKRLHGGKRASSGASSH